MADKVASTSSSVFFHPSEKRIICREMLESGFVALTTAGGLLESAFKGF